MKCKKWEKSLKRICFVLGVEARRNALYSYSLFDKV